MAKRKLRTDGDRVLRKKAQEVKNITSFILQLLDDMAETMYANNGVGLAANQIGITKRLIVVDTGEGLIKLINPKLLKGELPEVQVEGCLSVPERWGEVERFQKVVVKGKDEKGRTIKIEAQELLARVFQHEIDHLEGVLFIDRAQRVFTKPVETETGTETEKAQIENELL